MDKHYVAEQHLLQSPPVMSGDYSEVYFAPDVDTRVNDLEKALRGLMEWIDGWDPNFTQDPDWPATKREIARVLMVSE